jgi:hypothetical protein
MPEYFFALTHSARVMDFARASLHALQQRYGNPARLSAPPPFSSLPPESNPHYTGNLTLWIWNPSTEREPRFLELIRKPYKAQQAILDGDELVVSGTNHLEIFPLWGDKSTPRRSISHPWFAGGHTVALDERGCYIVSCSGPDAILVFRRDGTLERAWRVPEDLYGRNYELRAGDDLRQHYIHNDLQIAHVNCGTPTPSGLLCTSLIPGAIGLFEPNGRYREILRGYVGCHGARWDRMTDTLYFCDSCNGNVVEIDWAGRLLRRVKFPSAWLQDAHKFGDELWLAGLSDQNVFTLWDSAANKAIWTISGEGYGQTTQFCSWSEIDDGLAAKLRERLVATGPHTFRPAKIWVQPFTQAAHAQPSFFRRAMSSLLKQPPPPELASWMLATPHPHILGDGQWLQIMAFVREFEPDVILELGVKSGRLAACASSICAGTSAHHLATNFDPDWEQAKACRPASEACALKPRTVIGTHPVDVIAALASSRRIAILCGNFEPGLTDLLLRHILPAVRDKDHCVVVTAISDGRLNPRLPYADGGESYWVIGDVIGMKSEDSGLLPLVDFTTRNELTLFSADLGLQEIQRSEPELLRSLIVAHGGPAFGGAHWRWFTLNERQPPFVFPTPT